MPKTISNKRPGGDSNNALLFKRPKRVQWDGMMQAPIAVDVASTRNAFSPDGRHFVALDWKDTTPGTKPRMWTRTDREWKAASFLTGHTGPVCSASFSSDGNQIVTASDDTTVKVWRVEANGEWKVQSSFHAHATNIAFSPDGTRIVTVSHDHTVQIWNPTGTLLHSLNDPDFHGPAFHLFGPFAFGGLAFSPDSRKVLLSSTNLFGLWNLDSGDVSKCRMTNDMIMSLSFSPDGRYVVVGSMHIETLVPLVQSTGRVTVFDLEHGGKIEDCTCVRSFTHSRPCKVSDASFSPDGKYIVSCGSDNTVKVWSMRSGKCLKTFCTDSYALCSVMFSQDGQSILVGSYNRMSVYDASILSLEPPNESMYELFETLRRGGDIETRYGEGTGKDLISNVALESIHLVDETCYDVTLFLNVFSEDQCMPVHIVVTIDREGNVLKVESDALKSVVEEHGTGVGIESYIDGLAAKRILRKLNAEIGE